MKESKGEKSRRACWFGALCSLFSLLGQASTRMELNGMKKLVKLLQSYWAWHLIADFDRFRLDILFVASHIYTFASKITGVCASLTVGSSFVHRSGKKSCGVK